MSECEIVCYSLIVDLYLIPLPSMICVLSL